MDRERINKRLFGISLEGNNRIPLTQKATQTLRDKNQERFVTLPA